MPHRHTMPSISPLPSVSTSPSTSRTQCINPKDSPSQLGESCRGRTLVWEQQQQLQPAPSSSSSSSSSSCRLLTVMASSWCSPLGVQSKMPRRQSGTRTWELLSAGLERMFSMLNEHCRPLLPEPVSGAGSADILGQEQRPWEQELTLSRVCSLCRLWNGVLQGKKGAYIAFKADQ